MDSKLKLKPIELIDIGIDKHTKIPIPILSENIISTYDIENGLPSDVFKLVFDTNYADSSKFIASMTSVDYDIIISIDWGDGEVIEHQSIQMTGNQIEHTYITNGIYTITISGWLEKITSLIVIMGGIKEINISNIKKLTHLDFSNNLLTSIDIYGLVYLKNIYLKNNYLTNDEIDDLYINADTCLTYYGELFTDGDNNGVPSIYSQTQRDSLMSKGWTITEYNN
jgi:Leucine-rich repeat (LRR) protein